MRTLREWLVRLANTLRPARSDADMAEELRSHLEMAGVGAHAGRLAHGLESMRDQRGLSWLRDFGRDIRHGLRRLVREPAFSLVAIASLALGIGANTSIFTLVDRVLIRPLPVPHPEALVFLSAVGTDGGGGAPPYPCFERFREGAPAFESLSAFAADELPIEVDGAAEQVFGQVASGNYFDLLRLTPALGRLMRPDDERLEPAVAVIGYAYWQRRFGGDPAAIGRTITFRQRPFTIVGVTPPEFSGLLPGRRVDLTLPITVERQYMSDAGGWWMEAIGRRRAGVTTEEARVQVDTIFQGFMASSEPSGLRTKYFDRMELTSAARGMNRLRLRFATPLYGLTVVAALVLAIACVNLGSLLLVRGGVRSREFAIRLATGAGAGRLVRQSLTETGLLVAAGATAGLAVAVPLSRVIAASFAVGRNPIVLDVALDWRVVIFTAAVSAIVAFTAGALPALRTLAADPQHALQHAEERVAGSRRVAGVSQALIAVQVSISCVLVVSAVLFGRSIIALRNVDTGFARDHVLTMSLDPMLPPGAEAERRVMFWKNILERVREMKTVRAASLSVFTPLSGRDTTSGVTVAGFQPRDETDRLVHVNHVTAEFFRTFGMALLAGRSVDQEDVEGRQPVVVINEASARAYFGSHDPIGQVMSFGPDQRRVVVGVVRDARHLSLRETPPRFAFIPLWQPHRVGSRITLSVATDQDGAGLVRAIAHEAIALEPRTLVSDVIGVEEQIDATLVSERLLATLGLTFAAIALGLAAVGVYGIASYSVARRRVEFGIRMALGASPGRVAASVIAQLLPPLAAGIAGGLVLAVPAARLGRALLFGVSPDSVSVYAFSALLLAALAMLAAAVPAWRARSIDPTEALRRG